MKQRFVVLDGLRGIAAISVVIYHLVPQTGLSGYQPNGTLAVDFFFCLSGFVLASAHDVQLANGSLSLSRFALLRLIRVGPMVMLGTLLGASSLPWLKETWAPPPDLRGVTAFLSLFTLPAVRRGVTLWVNGVFWSLLAELIINGVYGLVGRRFRTSFLACMVLLSIAAVAWQFVETRSSNQHLESLWSLAPTICRAAMGFFIGVLLWRVFSKKSLRFQCPSWLPTSILILIIFTPATTPHLALVNLAARVSLIPVIVFLGALSQEKTSRVMSWLGEVSFPLYAIHSPIVVVAGYFIIRLQIDGKIFICSMLLAGLLGVANCVARYVDLPSRRLMRRTLLGDAPTVVG